MIHRTAQLIFLAGKKGAINGICSQFFPAAPRGFRQFCGAGRGKACFSRGGAACFSAGRGVHPWFPVVNKFNEEREANCFTPTSPLSAKKSLVFWGISD